ncbi:hypothetical protein Ae356Ps1_1629 [Pseudonocardia sp. Ae356_Ps1]|nr:hypothetical protein Ae356Ps1_1629 [Pseudonocardia sp. Ae356_Ps1]
MPEPSAESASDSLASTSLRDAHGADRSSSRSSAWSEYIPVKIDRATTKSWAISGLVME